MATQSFINFRELREAKGLTVAQAAEAIGIKETRLNNLEIFAGKGTSGLGKVCAYYNVDLDAAKEMHKQAFEIRKVWLEAIDQECADWKAKQPVAPVAPVDPAVQPPLPVVAPAPIDVAPFWAVADKAFFAKLAAEVVYTEPEAVVLEAAVEDSALAAELDDSGLDDLL